jgi:hypothetical protein
MSSYGRSRNIKTLQKRQTRALRAHPLSACVPLAHERVKGTATRRHSRPVTRSPLLVWILIKRKAYFDFRGHHPRNTKRQKSESASCGGSDAIADRRESYLLKISGFTTLRVKKYCFVQILVRRVCVFDPVKSNFRRREYPHPEMILASSGAVFFFPGLSWVSVFVRQPLK